jgi:hypothetical protein
MSCAHAVARVNSERLKWTPAGCSNTILYFDNFSRYVGARALQQRNSVKAQAEKMAAMACDLPVCGMFEVAPVPKSYRCSMATMWGWGTQAGS